MTDKKEKECKSCFQVKPMEAFYENQYSQDGRYSFCKVCFDLFIKGEEKQAKDPLAGFEKRCAKCKKIKLLNEFYEKPESIAGKESWCKSCQKKYLKAKKQRNKQGPQPGPNEEGLLSIETPLESPPEPEEVYQQPENKAPQIETSGGEEEEDLVPMEALIEDPPVPEEGAAEEPLDECMFLDMELDEIEGLLAQQIEAAPPPRPRVDIMLNERRCNGCNKVEPVIEVTRRVRVPVHAWFCDICKENNTRMYVRRGFVVYDEYGRAYKITKVLNDELLEGVTQKKNGHWGGEKVRIYGNWTTRG